MAAQSRGSTGLDGAHDARLFRGQGVGFPKGIAVAAKDLSHLELGPPWPRRVTRRRRQDAALAQHLSLGCSDHVQGASDRGEAFASDVQVTKGCLDTGVAEEDLDAAQVDAHLEEVRGEAVAQLVGSDPLADAGGPGGLLEGVGDGVAGDRTFRICAREQPLNRMAQRAPLD